MMPWDKADAPGKHPDMWMLLMPCQLYQQPGQHAHCMHQQPIVMAGNY
jgi:hypothetical protein